ncbi:hypothetical protein IV203_028506 [Nitzschia inconspicua]|uniref:Sulfotransferase domain-containing protein n=1 Tax=Nitzschia inconspicua TaxID=303405 RepID=A0A9K3LSR1_9STRA|nr:hypothetical protein IV203_028506 [Nitzschia inconspicua]
MIAAKICSINPYPEDRNEEEESHDGAASHDGTQEETTEFHDELEDVPLSMTTKTKPLKALSCRNRTSYRFSHLSVLLAVLVLVGIAVCVSFSVWSGERVHSKTNSSMIRCNVNTSTHTVTGGTERMEEQAHTTTSHGASSEEGPSEYLLECAQNRSRDYDSFVDPRYYKMVSGHPALENVLPKFQPDDEWAATHFPDINIIGLPKAGTSQLYNILVSHPRFRKFHLHSEFCFNLNDDDMDDLIALTLGGNVSTHDQQKIQQRLHIANEERLHSNKEEHQKWENLNKDTSHGILTVNKCVAPIKFWMQRQYLGRDRGPPSKRGKTILLLRDPAEWLWASWNYWLQIPYDDILPAYKNNWAKEPYQYRSPELFHEYMRAGNRMWPSKHLLGAFRDEKIALYNRILSEAVQNEDILVLKSEDMKPERIETSGFLDKLASFLGVAKVNFDKSVVHSFTNCGDHKGVENHECDDEEPTMSYTITGNRRMLPQTPELVYLHFAEECQMWKEKFNAEYDNCLAVREKYSI